MDGGARSMSSIEPLLGPNPVLCRRLGLSSLMVMAIRAQWPLLAGTAVYCGGVAWVLDRSTRTRPLSFGNLTVEAVAMSLVVQLVALITLRFLYMCLTTRPARPSVALYRDLKAFLSCPYRMCLGLPILIALILFAKSFTTFKYNIPALNPFSWDETFMRWDRAIHFGHQPFALLQPVLGHPIVTFIINLGYNLWFMVMWCFWVLLIFAGRSSELRTQFLMSFLLVWSVLGSLMAWALSSAGPCFYGLLGLPDDPYAGLMAYLREADQSFPIWALDIQQSLWETYTGERSVIAGISAMPSLHNGTALLFALTAWKIDRRIGIAFGLYAIWIFLGSIHLGWHYAVDAYIAWAMVLPIWWLSGLFARWNETRPAVRAYNELSLRARPSDVPLVFGIRSFP